jgi:hypothetical protein
LIAKVRNVAIVSTKKKIKKKKKKKKKAEKKSVTVHAELAYVCLV